MLVVINMNCIWPLFQIEATPAFPDAKYPSTKNNNRRHNWSFPIRPLAACVIVPHIECNRFTICIRDIK